MIYSIRTNDKAVAANVKTICSGAGDLHLRGYEKTAHHIFDALEQSGLIHCDW